jgi:hypothetical protein
MEEGLDCGVPMDNSFRMHVVDGINQLGRVVTRTWQREGAQLIENGLHLPVPSIVENKIWPSQFESKQEGGITHRVAIRREKWNANGQCQDDLHLEQRGHYALQWRCTFCYCVRDGISRGS